MMWMLRVKHIYNFSLFHANYIPLLHAFTSIIYHFIAFSRTNLLTRCQVPVAVFLLFLSFRKVVQQKSEEKSTKNQGVLLLHGEGCRKRLRKGEPPGGHAGPRRGQPLT